MIPSPMIPSPVIRSPGSHRPDPIARDPIARAQSRLSEKRYQDGHQQVTGLIERMREKRRRLFDRLWIASIALTALSVVALAVELIQGMQSPDPNQVATRPLNKNTLANKNAERNRQESRCRAPSRAKDFCVARAVRINRCGP